MDRSSILQHRLSVSIVLSVIFMAGCGGSNNNSTSSTLPQVVTVTPNTAPTSGPTTVTITGRSFSNSNIPVRVVFGKDVATNVTVISDTQITAVAPAKTAGGDVYVTTSNGTSPQTINDVFAGYPVPVSGLFTGASLLGTANHFSCDTDLVRAASKRGYSYFVV